MDSTGAALLRAVLLDHADDTPRLIFADWLEENGKAAWAKFIRTQILKEENPAASYPQFFMELPSQWWEWWQRGGGRKQEWKWLREHNNPDFKVLVERGFVQAVECPLGDWLGKSCHVCAGTGIGASPEVAAYIEIPGGCPRCSTDCTDGIGFIDGSMVVAVQQPVQWLRITDRFPQQDGETRFTWWQGGPPSFNWPLGSYWELPKVVFNELPDSHVTTWSNVRPTRKDYTSLGDARKALGTACLNLARKRAKLPPLEMK